MIFANPFARIVVGYDGSAPADVALDQALALARQYGGELVVVYLSDLSAPAVLRLETAAKAPKADPAPLLASIDPYRYNLFQKLSARVASRTVPVTLEFSMNRAVAGIVDAAVRWKATAIAVGTHARTGVAHTFIGSVAEGVVRNALVPVIVTREGMQAKPLHRIIVGVDVSEPSANASVLAVALAREHPVRPVYCSVVDTISILQPIADLSFDPTPLLTEMRAAARDALDSALQYANAADVYPDTEVAAAADIASGIIDVARRHAADAIVVGTHRRGNLERFFLGSTAESILRRSDVPVIVVPAHASIVPGPPARVPVET